MVGLTLLLFSSSEERSHPWDAEFPTERALFLYYTEQTPRWLSGGPALRGRPPDRLMALPALAEMRIPRSFEVLQGYKGSVLKKSDWRKDASGIFRCICFYLYDHSGPLRHPTILQMRVQEEMA